MGEFVRGGVVGDPNRSRVWRGRADFNILEVKRIVCEKVINTSMIYEMLSKMCNLVCLGDEASRYPLHHSQACCLIINDE